MAASLKAELLELSRLVNGHGVEFDAHCYENMSLFVDLLLEWNRSFNLISRADEGRIVDRHIVESVGLLLLAEAPAAARVLDIGSGGGFPALPMKIVRPDLRLAVVESNGKKARFLRNAGTRLALRNYAVYEKRVESLEVEEVSRQTLITARAVAGLPVLWKWAVELLVPEGRLLAIKGGEAREEIESVEMIGTVGEVGCLEFPEWLSIDKSRFVVSVKKKRAESEN